MDNLAKYWSSSFILKKARILVELQLQLTSLHTRAVSLEVVKSEVALTLVLLDTYITLMI